jgi:hypothetical protein
MAVNIHLEVRGLQILNNCPTYTTQGYSNDPITVFLPQLFFKMSQQKICGDINMQTNIHTNKADDINNTFRLLLTHIFHYITQNKHT